MPIWYSGNIRDRGYGIKADIRTPLAQPTLTNNGGVSFVVSWVGAGIDSGYPGNPAYWVQTGWDIHRDGGGANQACRAYWEWNDVAAYDFQQPGPALAWDSVQTYEVVYTGTQGLNFKWQVLNGGSLKANYYYTSVYTPAQVQAPSEINVATNQCRAGFNNVQFKGQYMYFLFDESDGTTHWWPANGVFSRITYNDWKYSTHANGM